MTAHNYTPDIEAYRLGSRVVIKGASWAFKGLTRADYAPEYEISPIKAERDYGANPPAVYGGVWPDPNIVDEYADKIRPLPANDACVFSQSFIGDPMFTYYGHFDLALSGDQVGFALVHYDFHKTKYVADVIMKIPVSKQVEFKFQRVVTIVDTLKQHGFNIVKITFDRWQSLHTIEDIRAMGIESGIYSVDLNTEAYDTLISLTAGKRFDYYYHPVYCKELKELILRPDGRYDHPPTGSKDVSDAVAGALISCVKAVSKIRFSYEDLQSVFSIPETLDSFFEVDYDSGEIVWKRSPSYLSVGTHSLHLTSDGSDLIAVHGYRDGDIFNVVMAKVIPAEDFNDVGFVMSFCSHISPSFVSASFLLPFKIVDALRSSRVRIVTPDANLMDKVRNRDMRIPRSANKEAFDMLVSYIKNRNVRLCVDPKLYNQISEFTTENWVSKVVAKAVSEWLYYSVQSTRQLMSAHAPSPKIVSNVLPGMPSSVSSFEKRGSGGRPGPKVV